MVIAFISSASSVHDALSDVRKARPFSLSPTPQCHNTHFKSFLHHHHHHHHHHHIPHHHHHHHKACLALKCVVVPPGEVPAGAEPIPGEDGEVGYAGDDGDDGDKLTMVMMMMLVNMMMMKMILMVLVNMIITMTIVMMMMMIENNLQTKLISVCQHSVVVAHVPLELLLSSGSSFILCKVDNHITGYNYYNCQRATTSLGLGANAFTTSIHLM